MNSRIVYSVKHQDWGSDHVKTGWYLVRITYAVDRQGEFVSIVDEKSIAKFVDTTDIFATSEVMTLDEAVRQGEFRMLPRDWTRKDLIR